MPGGPTQASINRSFIQLAHRLPRFELRAWWIGVRTWKATNTTPTKISGPVSEVPSFTAPINRPIETANNTGTRPRITSTTHHAMARPGAAR